MNTNPTTTTHRHTLVLTSVTARDFTVAASTVWNSLSINIPSADRFASLNFPYTLLNCLHLYLRHLGRFSAITSALRFVFCATYRTRSLSVVVVQVTLAKCQSSHPTDRQTYTNKLEITGTAGDAGASCRRRLFITPANTGPVWDLVQCTVHLLLILYVLQYLDLDLQQRRAAAT